MQEAIRKASFVRDGLERGESVEIRVYTHDIEDEDCDCFDYDTVEF